MAKTQTAVASDDHSDDLCENCGACKHCGHGGAQMVPQIVPMPYPVYPRPIVPAHPWGRGNYWPNVSGSGSSSAGTYTQTWNA